MEPIGDTPQQSQDFSQTPIMEQQQEILPVAQKTGSPMTLVLIVVGLVLLATVGAGAYYMGMQNTQQAFPLPEITEDTSQPDEVICTLDAKICPDGSSVGRVGPSCEFEECPNNTAPGGSDSTQTVKYQVSSTSGKGEKIETGTSKIILDLPAGSSVSDGIVEIDSIQYSVIPNLYAGLCGMTLVESDCNSTSEQFSKSEELKIWKYNSEVFALNIISIDLGEYYLDSLVVTKYQAETTSDTYPVFTDAEVAMWKEILKTIHLE